MNEVVKRIHQYRGYKITYRAKENVWIIYSTTGIRWGTTFDTPKEAKDYIDDLLKED